MCQQRHTHTNAPATTDEMKLRLSRTVFHISQSGQEHLSRQPDIMPDITNTLKKMKPVCL